MEDNPPQQPMHSKQPELQRLRFVGVVLVSAIMATIFSIARNQVQAKPKPAADSIRPAYPSITVFNGAFNHWRPSARLEGNGVSGAIVNHHLLAADFIVDTLDQAGRYGIDRILLLSPNHFSAGHGRVITTTGIFSTPYGDVHVDNQFVGQLVRQGTVTLDASPFTQEHGVFNLLPFIRRLYPGVRIVPVISKDGTPDQQIDEISRQLLPMVSPRTLVIASLDFAHRQTETGAERLDVDSLRRLHSLDPNTATLNTGGIIQIDSPPTLRLFLTLMHGRGAMRFTLLHHSNSAQETGQREATDVTSHITGLFRRFPIVVH